MKIVDKKITWSTRILALLFSIAILLMAAVPTFAIAEYEGSEIDITSDEVPKEIEEGAAAPVPMLKSPKLRASSISGDKSYTVDASHNDDAGFVIFKVDDYKGSCIQKGVDYKSKGTAKMSGVDNTKLLAQAAYYVDVVKGWYGNTTDRPKIMDDTGVASRFRAGLLAEDVIQCANQGTDSWSEKAAGQSYPDGYIKYVVNIVKNDLPGVVVPGNFIIYKGQPSDNSQDFAVWKLIPPGFAAVKKVSGNTGITG